MRRITKNGPDEVDHEELQRRVTAGEAARVLIQADIVRIDKDVLLVTHSIQGDGVAGLATDMKEIKVWKAAMDTTPEEISNLSRKIDDIIRDRAREKSEELNENRVTPKEIAANLLARNAARPVQVGRHDRCSPCIEGDMMPTSKKPTPKKPKSMLAKVHDRVFNGLGQELREEVSYAMGSFRVEVVKLLDDARKERREDISELRKLVIGVIVSMAILLGGVVLQNQISSAARSNENNRNLDAIKDLGVKLDLHIGGVDLPPGLPYRAQTKLGPK